MEKPPNKGIKEGNAAEQEKDSGKKRGRKLQAESGRRKLRG